MIPYARPYLGMETALGVRALFVVTTSTGMVKKHNGTQGPLQNLASALCFFTRSCKRIESYVSAAVKKSGRVIVFLEGFKANDYAAVKLARAIFTAVDQHYLLATRLRRRLAPGGLNDERPHPVAPNVFPP